MDLNRVLVAGRLTQDPELKNLPSGDPVCNFRLAINRKWTDSQTNEKREDACFIDMKCYGKRALVIHEHFRKGKNILVEGQLREERWEKDGQRRSKHVIVVDRFEFVDRAPAPPDAPAPLESPESLDEAPLTPAEPMAAGSAVARRRRENALAGTSAAIEPFRGQA